MHDQIEFVRSEQLIDPRAIANIQRRVLKSFRRFLQPLQIPQRVARRSKKLTPHIVVRADDIVSLRIEMGDRL